MEYIATVGSDIDEPRKEFEVTVLIPCLNERLTIGQCIEAAKIGLQKANLVGEILVSDNGSTDGSVEIAKIAGARVIHASVQGYGAALIAGIKEAHGEYIIMGDADFSYDFETIGEFVLELRKGHDLVMGNRFLGGIAPGAMPFLHRHLGNPVLSFLGRLFFKLNIGDFHCGLRGFNRRRMLELDLTSTGMEFASEMVVKAGLSKYSISEIPTKLRKDGRDRPPHLRTWRDGWRHLRFLLMCSPRWLFLIPGVVLTALGIVLSLTLLRKPFSITPSITLDIHSLIVASMAAIVGLNLMSFAVVAKRFAASHGFRPSGDTSKEPFASFTLERTLIMALALGLPGIVGTTWCVANWVSSGFGPIDYGLTIRVLVISLTAIVIALQLTFTAFLSEIVGGERR